jgi:hypothetical protein
MSGTGTVERWDLVAENEAMLAHEDETPRRSDLRDVVFMPGGSVDDLIAEAVAEGLL